MQRKMAKSQTQLSMLPEDLIVEHVLHNLPVITLIRFKSVSKYWFLTISSHEFMQKHLKFSSSRPQLIMLQGNYIYEPLYLLSLYKCSIVKELVEFECKDPVMIPPHYPRFWSEGSVCVMGTDNGLVCLYDKIFRFYVWNPATHQCRNAIAPDFDYPIPDDISGAGFGYVSSIDDYRIGCVFWACDEEVYHVNVFSLRTGKWERTASSNESYHYALYRDNVSVFVDDTIYWPPIGMYHGEGEGDYIAGLNLVSGQLKKFPLKNVVIDYEKIDVFRMKGCLSLCCISSTSTSDCVSDIWMLKQHDDWNSWEKVFSLNVGDTRLLHLFGTGKCVVGRYLEKLNLLDPLDKGAVIWQGSDEEDTRALTPIANAWAYVESLVSPFGTTV